MKLSRRYAIAFTLVLLPLVAWLGSDVVREDKTTECSHCGSTEHLLRHHWYVWGLRGETAPKEEIQRSLLLSDFPEFACQHSWDRASIDKIRLWGPLFKPIPVSRGVSFRHRSTSSFTTRLYLENATFREKLKDALKDKLVTRAQIARWFDYRWNNNGELFPLSEGEAEAFNNLNEIADQVTSDGPAFAPLPVQDPPPPAAPKPF